MADSYDQAAVDLTRSGTKEEGLIGCYRACVESIEDPDRLGRVRVRVYAVHGDKQRTANTALPWAEVSEIGGGGYDFGSFDPPPVGSTVFVMFEMGYAKHPIVVGTWRGIPKRDSDNPHIMLTSDNLPTSEKPWKPPDEGLETPKDVFDGVFSGDPHPTRRVWRKSYKGHTIVIEDGDGKEFIKIIDRAGQVIVMDCPVDKQFDEGNASQRGVRDAMRGDQLPHRIMKQRRASIRIRDLSGQEIVLDAADNAERVIIRSKSRGGTGENTVTLSSGKGKESIELKDSAGNLFRLDPNSDTPIELRDKTGNAIFTNKEKGQVCIVAAKEKVASVPRETKTVQGLKKSIVRGDEQKKIHGNKKTDIVGDLAVGILNNIAANVGGAVQLVIANSPSGVPGVAGTALDISVTVGKTKLHHVLGSILLDTIAGDVEMSTIAGDADVKTLAGNAEIGNLLASTKYDVAGNITAKSTLIHSIDGSIIQLGGIAALNPLIKTLTFMPPWLAATQALGVAGTTAASTAGGLPNPFTNAAAIAIIGAALQAYAVAMAPLLVPATPAFYSIKSFTA